jgi:photosystem II stability/assembly factor-like uncharacterized protein
MSAETMLGAMIGIRTRRTAAAALLGLSCFAVAAPANALFGEKPVGPIAVPKNTDLATPSSLAQQFLLLGVARAGTGRIVTVGEYGHILLSDDEGKTWRQAKSVQSKVTLTSVVFAADGQRGWAVGHDTTVLHTADAGETWTRQYGGTDSDNALLTVVFLDDQRGLAMGAFNYTIETADGGKTWSRRQLTGEAPKPAAPAPDKPAEPAAPAQDADAAQAQADAEAEAKAKERGLDGAYQTAEGDDAHLNAAFLGPNGAVYVAAEAGKFYRSSDSGKTFERIQTPYPGSYWGGVVLTDGSIVLTGMRGNIWRSVDQGKTWTKANTAPADQSLASVIQAADGSLIAVGLSGGILVSKDGGKSFGVYYRDDRKSLNSVVTTADGRTLVFGEAGIADVTPEMAKIPAAATAQAQPAAAP